MTRRLLADLALARGPLRDDADLREHPDWWEAARSRGALGVAVRGDRVAVADGGLAWREVAQEGADAAVFLGMADGVPRIALPGAEAPAGAELVSLRLCGAELSGQEAALATTAVALAGWHSRNAFCARCAAATVVSSAGWSRTCIADGTTHFPRTDPAVIVLVRDEHDRALLGSRADWPEQWYSTLAGFVEAGESVEHTIRREIAEEAGVEIDPDRLLYRGSQPWPFPSSLMLGFHAWAMPSSGDPRPDGEEIARARWFSREELAAAAHSAEVRIPPRVSIARHLIEDWYGDRLPGGWSRP